MARITQKAEDPILVDDAPPMAEDGSFVNDQDDPFVNDQVETTQAESAQEEYEYVRLPNGQVVAVPKSEIQSISVGAMQAGSVRVEEPDVDVYVWLTDGSVERVPQSELPGPAGTNAAYGHWTRDGKTYQIVNVYPVETGE